MPYKNPEKQREYWAEYRKKIKREVIEAFGGKCIICGTMDFSVLQLVHPNGDGKEHRELLGLKITGGHCFYLALRKRGWNTDGFKVVIMCKSHHHRFDKIGSKNPNWGKKGRNHPRFEPKSTNIMTKYKRYKKNPEQFPMTEGDWQQYRKSCRERNHTFYQRQKELKCNAK